MSVLFRSFGTTLALMAMVALAWGENRRVALVGADAPLQDAVSTALSPWHIEVRPVQTPAPGPAMPGAADRARAIARENAVDAVVWISRAEDGEHALWLYDSDGDRVVAQKLSSAPPFADAAAAAVALSIKTLLRHSTVAPAQERYAADLLDGRGPHAARLRFESNGGARLRRDNLEPRLGLAMSWWPTTRFAAALAVQSGPGIAVDEAAFVGRFTDTTLGLSARAKIELGARFELVPELGASLHLTDLDGAVLTPEQRVHTARTNPSADLAVEIRHHIVADLRVGLRIGGAYLLRKQRYLVRSEPVYTLPSVEWAAALVVNLPLY